MSLNLNQILRNGFTEGLGTDWIAVDKNGSPFARASSREAVERAVSGTNTNDAVMFVTGKDFEDFDAEQAAAAGGAAFDHDHDGKPGGSLKHAIVEAPPAPAEPPKAPEPLHVQPHVRQHAEPAPAKKAPPRK